MPSFPPTPEQQAIIDAAVQSPANIMITAGAGCTKTTTLQFVANALPQGEPFLALAFNVKIKKELERVFPAHATIWTLNGLGHRAFGRALGRQLILEDRKIGKLVTQLAQQQGQALSLDQWSDTKDLVGAAMAAGLVPRGLPGNGLMADTPANWETLLDLGDPAIVPLAQAVLRESIRQSFQGIICFDDQIYMSVCFGGVFPKFPLVMVDEAQDLSPLNHEQVRRCAAGRLIVVGDPKQAIYAFRGADSASMSKLRALRPEWLDLPLLTTFRCPRVVVQRQQTHVPGFAAAASNALGALGLWPRHEAWSWTKLEALKPHSDARIAVLCRNNAPLLGLAFKFIRRGIGVVMLGRDIGKGLVTLSKKIAKDDSLPIAAFAEALARWAEQQRALAQANDKLEKISGINDREECLQAVIEFSGAQTAGALRSAIGDLFSRETGVVTLATGHRAKGLEWDVVLHLDPWRIPSRFARDALDRGDPRQMEQERNLLYVLETRTKHTLAQASLEDFE